jgi:hypothetical protein
MSMSFTSRERVAATLAHEAPDRVPLDLGGSVVTGMHVSSVYALRQALQLDPPGTPVKVIEPFQMLGEVSPDLQDALGVDVVELSSPTTMFGFAKAGWKPWRLADGTPLLVPGAMNTEPDPDGAVPMYPQGDRAVPPCARMPRGGYYFDAVDRQGPLDWAGLDVEENLEEFALLTPDGVRGFKEAADRLHAATERAIFANFGGTSFGDIALVPGLPLKRPRGVRGVKEWYMAHVRRPDYVATLFDRQCALALRNLDALYRAVREKVTVVFVTGTDFGTQRGPILSTATYRKLYRPVHQRVNDWIHDHTPWRTFIHTCGAVEPLIPEFIAAGFDVLNPVQTSAVNMGPHHLKRKYGRDVTFWGGGVDTQTTLPFGDAEQVRRQVRQRLRVFAPRGGFVYNTIHNVQPGVPVANLLAMYRAVRDHGAYPVQ